MDKKMRVGINFVSKRMDGGLMHMRQEEVRASREEEAKAYEQQGSNERTKRWISRK